MADNKSDIHPSGLTSMQVEQALVALKADWHMRECLVAALAGRRADISFFVESTKQFVDAGGAPLVAGFKPELICDLDRPADKAMTSAQAAARPTSTLGFVAGVTIDVSTLADPAAFFQSLISTFGKVTLSPRLQPTLTRSVPFIAADQTSLKTVPASATAVYDGTGITVCVVDMGCDFAHRNFRTLDEDMKTRFKFLTVTAGDGSGTAYNTATIDGWLTSNSIYGTYDPHNADYNCLPIAAGDGTHGTLVLDIAAGNGGGTGFKGTAPNADLAFAQAFVSETNGRRYVSGVAVYNAMKYMLDQLPTSTTPTVVSVSLGTNDGPHDHRNFGITTWTRQIDALFSNTNKGRALVWSAGNQGLTDAHISGRFVTGSPTVFDVRLPRGEAQGSEFKLWFKKTGTPTMDIKGMLADYFGAPGTYAPAYAASPVNDEQGNAAITLSGPTQYGTNLDLYYFQAAILPGPLRATPITDKDRWEVWRFQVTTSAGTMPFDGWLDHDARAQARFVTGKAAARADVDPNGSLSAAAAGISNATIVGAITPGGFQPGKPIYGPGQGTPISFSSYGPTRANLQRPDVSAPGDAIRGARSKGDPIGTGAGYGPVETIAMTGTSMAAPHVAGVIALYFDKLKRANTTFPTNYPSSSGVRTKLRTVARPDMPGGSASWDAQSGCGCVDATLLLK